MQRTYAKLRKTAATLVAIGTLSFLVSVPRAQADDRDHRARCQHQIERAEARLDDAVRRHGEHSHQARDRQRDLNAQREQCWREVHSYWNGHDHQWHEQHDWNIVVSH